MITASSLLDRDRKQSFLAPHYVNLMGLPEVKIMEFWCYPLGLCHSRVLYCILVHIQPPAVQEKWLFQCSHQPLISAASVLGKQISVWTGFAQLTDWGWGGGSFTLWPQFSDDSKKSCLFLVWPFSCKDRMMISKYFPLKADSEAPRLYIFRLSFLLRQFY